jgi:hypothetical protein
MDAVKRQVKLTPGTVHVSHLAQIWSTSIQQAVGTAENRRRKEMPERDPNFATERIKNAGK